MSGCRRSACEALPTSASHHGLMRTPKFITAEAPAASVPTLALTVPVLPAVGAVIEPWLIVATTAAL